MKARSTNKTCRKAEMHYRKTLTQHLINIGKSNPSGFWKLINKMNNWGEAGAYGPFFVRLSISAIKGTNCSYLLTTHETNNRSQLIVTYCLNSFCMTWQVENQLVLVYRDSLFVE